MFQDAEELMLRRRLLFRLLRNLEVRGTGRPRPAVSQPGQSPLTPFAMNDGAGRQTDVSDQPPGPMPQRH